MGKAGRVAKVKVQIGSREVLLPASRDHGEKICPPKVLLPASRDLDLGLGFEFMPDLTLKPGALCAPGPFS